MAAGSSRKQQVKRQKWQRVQRNNKRTLAALEKWLDQSSRELKTTSAYLLERQVEVNMQTLEQAAGTIEDNYNSFVSAASKFINNFTYKYPGRNHVESIAEIPEEFPEQRPVGGHVRCPTVQCYYLL